MHYNDMPSFTIILFYLGANSPQRGLSTSNPRSPSLRNRSGAEPSSVVVSSGVCYRFESLRIMISSFSVAVAVP